MDGILLKIGDNDFNERYFPLSRTLIRAEGYGFSSGSILGIFPGELFFDYFNSPDNNNVVFRAIILNLVVPHGRERVSTNKQKSYIVGEGVKNCDVSLCSKTKVKLKSRRRRFNFKLNIKLG